MRRLPPIDAVVSVHGGDRCGVTRFNRRLAEKMDVQHLHHSRALHGTVLLSVKPTELPPDFTPPDRYALLLHGLNGPVAALAANASWVGVVDPQIKAGLGKDVDAVWWCPSTLPKSAPRPTTQRDVSWVVGCGMAHKFHPELHRRLRAQLPADVRVHLSGMVHCGVEDPGRALDGLRADVTAIYPTAIFYGEATDEEIADLFALPDAAVVALYPSGVRQNNTIAWAALEAGRPLITTLGEWSPPELVHNETCWNVLDPHGIDWGRAERLASRGPAIAERYGWGRLVGRVKAAQRERGSHAGVMYA